MSDYVRNGELFSLCGLNCGLCGLRLGGHCGGCAVPGGQKCALTRCAREHGDVEYCFQCGEFPCNRYENFAEYDSFVVCQNRMNDISRARLIGIDAYLAEQKEKTGILSFLLDNFNDGRHKSFFIAAVSLLPLENLINAVSKLDARADSDIKEKSALAKAALNAEAESVGIRIKLNKKPKKQTDKA